jgi:predicted RNA-binding Zn-ribbon protein involved in translation (DUF1610 family)
MPLFDVKCEEHGTKEIYRHHYPDKAEEFPCPICGVMSPRDWKGCGAPELWNPYWTESLSVNPVYIASKKQEQAIEKKYHLQRVY